MAWSVEDIPNLTGRIAVVTGANGGLGLETARALAGAGAHVVMAARDPEKTKAAEADIRASLPSADLEVVPLDLASLASVRVVGARYVCYVDPVVWPYRSKSNSCCRSARSGACRPRRHMLVDAGGGGKD